MGKNAAGDKKKKKKKKSLENPIIHRQNKQSREILSFKMKEKDHYHQLILEFITQSTSSQVNEHHIQL